METLRVDPRIRAASPAKLGEDGFARPWPGKFLEPESRQRVDDATTGPGNPMVALFSR